MLKIYGKNTKRGFLVTLSGSLDFQSHNDLKKFLAKELDGVRHLILNMEKVDYVSSAGFGVILEAEQIMEKKGDMVLVNVQPQVLDVMEAIGFLGVLNIDNLGDYDE